MAHAAMTNFTLAFPRPSAKNMHVISKYAYEEGLPLDLPLYEHDGHM